MVDWLSSNIANIIVIAVVAAVVAGAVIVIIKDKKAGKSSCGCNCSNCALAGKCHSVKESKRQESN